MEQCVMITGTMKMPLLSALNLDSLAMVSNSVNSGVLCYSASRSDKSLFRYKYSHDIHLQLLYVPSLAHLQEH